MHHISWLDLKDEKDRTPLDIAKIRQNQDMIEHIQGI